MQTHNPIPLVSLVLLATLAGCATISAKAPGDQRFASDAVIRELRETRPAFTALTANEQSTVYLWLLAKCAVGAGDVRDQFAKLSTHTELVFIEAFRMGPPIALLAELADTRRNDYTAIRERLDGEDRELFDSRLRERLIGVPEDAYVREGIERTILAYRLAALDGLAQVGSQASIAWLERTVPTLTEPELRRASELALTTLRARQPR